MKTKTDNNGNKSWHKDNLLHREDGPAVIWANGRIEYWINGVQYNSLSEGLMDQAIR